MYPTIADIHKACLYSQERHVPAALAGGAAGFFNNEVVAWRLQVSKHWATLQRKFRVLLVFEFLMDLYEEVRYRPGHSGAMEAKAEWSRMLE